MRLHPSAGRVARFGGGDRDVVVGGAPDGFGQPVPDDRRSGNGDCHRGGSGTAEFDLNFSITKIPGRNTSVIFSVYDGDTIASRLLFYRSLSTEDPKDYLRDRVNYPVVAGKSYRLVLNLGTGFPSRSGRVTWRIPESIRTRSSSAVRTASGEGWGMVDAGQGSITFGGFHAPPAPVQGGRMSAARYTLTWDNPLVQLGFSDTRSQTTGNPNALILARTLPAPVITRTPASIEVRPGGTAIFTATVTGHEPITYQWLHEGRPLDGAVTPTLQIPVVTPAHAGSYTFRVTNPLGSTVSAPALLTLSSPPPPPTAGPGLTIERLSTGGERVRLAGTGGLPGRRFAVLGGTSLTDIASWSVVGNGRMAPIQPS